MAALGLCTALTHLQVFGGIAIRNLLPLASCTRLTTLELIRCDYLMDLRPLATACPRLVTLTLSMCTEEVGLSAQMLLEARPGLKVEFM